MQHLLLHKSIYHLVASLTVYSQPVKSFSYLLKTDILLAYFYLSSASLALFQKGVKLDFLIGFQVPLLA